MRARVCVGLALAWMTATICAALTSERFADYSYNRPDGWALKTDAVTHLVALAPDKHASAIFIQPQKYTGSAATWHRELWARLVENYKPLGTATDGQTGPFASTYQAFDRGDGTQVWLCLYTALNAGLGHGLLYSADAEAPFRAHLPEVTQLIAGITFVSAEPIASSVSPAPSATPIPNQAVAPNSQTTGAVVAAAPTPTPAASAASLFADSTSPDPAANVSDLSVEPPAGWSVQTDPKTRATILLPPGVNSLNVAGLVIFPAVPYTGTAEQFQKETVDTVVRGKRLLEPLKSGSENGLAFTLVHLVTAQGEEDRFVIYSARWGQRAQAFAFATAREDLFHRDGPIANAALQKINIPGFARGSVAISPTAVPANPVQTTPSISSDAESIPVLDYTDPPNFYRGGIQTFAEYTGTNVNFALCVYPFRPYTGDVQTAFRQTLLRDWIDIRYQEQHVAGPPNFSPNHIPGATAVMEARFQENAVGLPIFHDRILIVAGNYAAIVDMKTPTAVSWQTASASANVMLASLSVGKTNAPPAVANGPGEQGGVVAGLFVGTKMKYRALGATTYAPALHYYLFSADGHVYRCYDFPPGGSEQAARSFNFDAAARQDPVNSGRFALQGNQLYIKWDASTQAPTTTALTDPNSLVIDSVNYRRKW